MSSLMLISFEICWTLVSRRRFLSTSCWNVHRCHIFCLCVKGPTCILGIWRWATFTHMIFFCIKDISYILNLWHIFNFNGPLVRSYISNVTIISFLGSAKAMIGHDKQNNQLIENKSSSEQLEWDYINANQFYISLLIGEKAVEVKQLWVNKFFFSFLHTNITRASYLT